MWKQIEDHFSDQPATTKQRHFLYILFAQFLKNHSFGRSLKKDEAAELIKLLVRAKERSNSLEEKDAKIASLELVIKNLNEKIENLKGVSPQVFVIERHETKEVPDMREKESRSRIPALQLQS